MCRPAIGLAFGALAIAFIGGLIRDGLVQMRIAFAADQIAIFQDCVEKSEKLDSAEIDELLLYVQQYYPSGSKQPSGSPLDKAVEDARRIAVQSLRMRQRLISSSGN